jgi:hypothetical protein
MIIPKQIKVGNCTLPTDFAESLIINDRLAIMTDGSSYALEQKGVLTIKDLPTDGRVHLDGLLIQYKPNSKPKLSTKHLCGYLFLPQYTVEKGIQYSTTQKIQHDGKNMTFFSEGRRKDYDLDVEIDTTCIHVLNGTGNILLSKSPNNKAHIRGSSATKPLTDRVLHKYLLDNFSGSIELPEHMNIDITREVGDVKGDMYNGFSIEVKVGHIDVDLHIPMAIHCKKTGPGEVITNLVYNGERELYLPSVPSKEISAINSGVGTVRFHYEK